MKYKSLLRLQPCRLFFILCFCHTIYYAQTKDEQEERITSDALPQNIQSLISDLPKTVKRLKFYKETDGDKQSFETKFKYQKQLYSLEFSKDGVLEDIEVIIKFKNIDRPLKTTITTYFNSNYDKFRLQKIQRQYVYNASLTPNEFIANVLSNTAKSEINYEIIADVKTASKRLIREFTFSKNGRFLYFRTAKSSTYEHVLY